MGLKEMWVLKHSLGKAGVDIQKLTDDQIKSVASTFNKDGKAAACDQANEFRKQRKHSKGNNDA